MLLLQAHTRELGEHVEKLRSTSEIAALVAGFAVVGMLDFEYSIDGKCCFKARSLMLHKTDGFERLP